MGVEDLAADMKVNVAEISCRPRRDHLLNEQPGGRDAERRALVAVFVVAEGVEVGRLPVGLAESRLLLLDTQRLLDTLLLVGRALVLTPRAAESGLRLP